MGRAIVRNAKVFLMDEPLSNLDAKLRVQMRSEIIKLHERIGATTIYVTHDQTEAMTMASRIVVMSKGHIQQIGTPKEIYNDPQNMFVASFVGAPATNFVNGIIRGNQFVWEGFSVNIPEHQAKELQAYEGQEVVMGIRPENIHKAADGTPNSFLYDVEVSELLGHESILHGSVGTQKLIAKVSVDETVPSHSKVAFKIDPDKMYFFDKQTKVRIV